MTWHLGETGRLRMELRDYDGQPLTADSIELKIYDPSAVLKATVSNGFSNPSTGVYTYDYTVSASDSAGSWKARWKATIASKDSIEEYYFEVKA